MDNAAVFNEGFAFVFTPEHLHMPCDMLYDCRIPPMGNVCFTVCGTARAIDHLPTGAAPVLIELVQNVKN